MNAFGKSTLRFTALCLCMLQVDLTTAFAAQSKSQPETQVASSSSAQAPESASDDAPVPTQIAAAHTVFLSNLGADANFPIDAAAAYSAVYRDLKAWGRYQLVGSPQQADLILQLHDLSTYTTYTGNHGSTYTINNPSFQFTIIDAKSNVALWTISSPVYVQGRKQTLASWQALDDTNLVSRFKVLAGDNLTNTETADLTTVPKTHTKALLLGVGGFLVVAGVGGLPGPPHAQRYEGLTGRFLQRTQHSSKRMRRRLKPAR